MRRGLTTCSAALWISNTSGRISISCVPLSRVRGDVVDVFPAGSSETALRIEFFGDTVERIREIDAVTATPVHELKHAMIFPATHYVIGGDREEIFRRILADKEERVRYFEERGKLIEAQRINERVNYDVEMMREVGYCSGIENYSRYFDGRSPGQPPYTLLDFFPKDFVTFIDESHMTLPQLRAMYNGDLARKKNLVDYGFRLPAAYDNRPLNFAEFDARIKQFVCVSATPARYELELCGRCGGTAHPPDGSSRSRDRGEARQRTGGGPARRDKPRHRRGGQGAGHHAHQEDGGKPDRLSPRIGGEGQVYALGHRHPRAHRDRGRTARRRLRCAGGHKTCCAKGWIFPRCAWSPSSTRTRKAF